MKNVKPLKNLKLKVKKKTDMKKLQELYKRCSHTQTDVIEHMNDLGELESVLQESSMMIEKRKKEIEQLEALVEDKKEAYKKVSDSLKAIREERIEQENAELFETLKEVSLASISSSDITIINNNILKTGTFTGKKVDYFIESGLEEGFDIDFVEKQIIIENPSPMLTKVLMAKEYEKRDARYRKLRNIAEKKKSTLKSKK